MERDRRDYVIKNGESDFNSHAHVERDVEVSFHKYGSAISTHTLTWSVTVSYAVTEIIRVISTHTLTWSVTLADWLKYENVIISTHTLTWSVTLFPLPLCLSFQISTHTLTWSVTGDKLWEFVAGINFNSHAHVERDISHVFCS